jgi:hypothetical protein
MNVATSDSVFLNFFSNVEVPTEENPNQNIKTTNKEIRNTYLQDLFWFHNFW